MTKITSILVSVAALSLAACQSSSPEQKEDAVAATSDPLILAAREQFEPLPDGPAKIAGVKSTPEIIALGTALYFDPRLSASHSQSCAGCHNMGLGGADARPTSLGHRWQHGSRNAPTVLNAAYNMAQFWDGRAKDLAEQAGGPITNPVEMAMAADQVVPTLKSIPGYAGMFTSAFPGDQDPIRMENVQAAIAAYEATLVTPNAPFDRFLKGDGKALNETQRRGLQAFMDNGCSACHNGVNMGGSMYAKFGAVSAPSADLLPPDDLGRFAITKDDADSYSFKVPTLRNIALTAPYFHTGKVWSLDEAVTVMAKSQLGEALAPQDVSDIVAFLQALTGDQPKTVIPALPPVDGSSKQPLD
ncbi:cytochrome-c peroxidase [Novosphingobium mangrovi (ex Huang et al. 2023)]|uniref:Cytochrome-c peroxidase n=1 Tax=Novosphingobium mangrovi (ex Huang et al. 2023) TaxID=2976432 RepID=A0ABT2I4M7_9SPHN|nr:cytochrome-c peroxidase [Novosphingobium mangrovi (ex Huang et al. 2023)]MCT2399537.1 cytochrome-c peroxidase [Novosphingobium mangrovi (ex Huang et al. 2023)]